MSATSASRAREAVENARYVAATELTCATQALEFVADHDPGAGTGAAADLVREVVPPLETDRPVGEDVAAVDDLIASGRLTDRVETAIDGDLQ
jgi:histidine ammonia-lyase